MRVTDRGAPGAVGAGEVGFGIVGMRERVEALGGALTAGPRAGGGWAVGARIPRPPRGSA